MHHPTHKLWTEEALGGLHYNAKLVQLRNFFPEADLQPARFAVTEQFIGHAWGREAPPLGLGEGGPDTTKNFQREQRPASPLVPPRPAPPPRPVPPPRVRPSSRPPRLPSGSRWAGLAAVTPERGSLGAAPRPGPPHGA